MPMRWMLLAAACLTLGAQANDLEDAKAAQTRGAALHRKGDLQGALREFDRAVRLAPRSELAWYNRGLVRRDLKDCRAAVGDFDHALEVQPRFFNALYQRGNCRQQLGEYEAAIADYSRAIELPGRADAGFIAYFGRADAYRRMGRLDEAYRDYSAVSQVRNDTRALRSRAWVECYRGRWRECHADAARYLAETGGAEPDAPYAVILGMIALRRAGDTAAAAAFAQKWQPERPPAAWPGPVLAYLQGATGEKALLSAARDAGQRTEAGAYIGQNLLWKGEARRAIDVLRRVLREGDARFFEYDLAYHELRRLGAAQPHDRRPPPAQRQRAGSS